jgi:beta-lactamase superfamily II metal-dependent hydrolase
MLHLTAFPAAEGDCFLLEWGEAAAPRRMLIDAGRASTWRRHLKAWFAGRTPTERRIDFFVVTHIDRDHIEGALGLAGDQTFGAAVDEIWFNAWQHLVQPRTEQPRRRGEVAVLAPLHGEKLSRAILARGWRWNGCFSGGAVTIAPGTLPVLALPGGAVIRLLSPDVAKLRALAPVWRAECIRAGLVPGQPTVMGRTIHPPASRAGMDLAAVAARTMASDDAVPNGSSIAFMFEFDGRRILFAADAHPELLVASLATHYGEAPVRVDLFKAAHHGSRANVTLPLCRAIDCEEALISTNGSLFSHPDEEAVARIILTLRGRRTLHFNYASDMTRSWNDAALMTSYKYRPTYPTGGMDGYCVLSFGTAGIERLPR